MPLKIPYSKKGEKSNINLDVEEVISSSSGSSSPKDSTILSPRHLQLITFGGGIGTGLFITTGGVLSTSGPASLMIAFIILSFLVWSLMNQLGEMISFIPLPGQSTLYALSKRYAGKSISVAAGWNIFYAQAIIAPTEVTACAFLIKYWTDANSAIFVSIFLVSSMIITFTPVKVLGEVEFILSSFKVICLLILIITGIVIFFGGAPNQHHILGFHYWKNPGSFKGYILDNSTGIFLGVWIALVKGGFSFALVPELLTSCIPETRRPRKHIPEMCGKFIYRLIFFFVLAPLVVSIIVASNNPRLLNAKGTTTEGSPFVIGIQNVGIKGLSDFVNAGILASAWSCGNLFFYSSSRVLYSMALQGDAPRIFAKTNKFGIPMYSCTVTGLISLLAYLNCSNSSAIVFTWLTNIATISGFISWIFTSITFFRFRIFIKSKLLADKVSYKPAFQIVGATSCLIMFSLLAITNGFSVFFPQNWSVSSFIASYITIPVVLLVFVISLCYKRDWNIFYKPDEIEYQYLLDEVEAEESLINDEK